jgi:hypothetical protein
MFRFFIIASQLFCRDKSPAFLRFILLHKQYYANVRFFLKEWIDMKYFYRLYHIKPTCRDAF